MHSGWWRQLLKKFCPRLIILQGTWILYYKSITNIILSPNSWTQMIYIYIYYLKFDWCASGSNGTQKFGCNLSSRSGHNDASKFNQFLLWLHTMYYEKLEHKNLIILYIFLGARHWAIVDYYELVSYPIFERHSYSYIASTMGHFVIWRIKGIKNIRCQIKPRLHCT